MIDRRAAPRGVVSVCSHEPDEAQTIGRQVYHPHQLSVARSVTPFEMRLRAASLGPVTVGTLGYSDEVRIDTGPLNAYQVNIPLGGSLQCWSEAGRVVADPTTGVVFGPRGDTGFSGFCGGGRLLGIKIDGDALDAEMTAMTGHEQRGAALPALLDISTGRGEEWWLLARSLVDLLESPDGLLANPLVARPLARTLLVGLLVALGIPETGPLSASAAAAPVVRRAVQLLEDRPAEPLTIADVAAEVGASVRTLQAGFRRDLGTTPMGYLRDVRLGRAHSDLIDADPALATVGEIARRWGFDHLGRFATAHRRRFGIAPSEALHRGA